MTAEVIAPGVRCLRAANPSPMTGTGTNTYLVGTTDLAVIDPGPDMPDHLDAILASLHPGQRVIAIIVTHAHKDHSALAPRLSARTGAPTLAFGTATDGQSPLMRSLALPSSGEGLDLAFLPDRRLRDDETVNGSDWTLTAIHTPGHLGGHVCLAMDDVLFSGDHVMGWASSLISPPDGDMSAYMASLERISRGNWRRLLPGHGAPVEDPATRIRDLIEHRRGREAQILSALTETPTTLQFLTRSVYHDIPPAMLPAAQRNAFAHLIDLSMKKQIIAQPNVSPDALYSRR